MAVLKTRHSQIIKFSPLLRRRPPPPPPDRHLVVEPEIVTINDMVSKNIKTEQTTFGKFTSNNNDTSSKMMRIRRHSFLQGHDLVRRKGFISARATKERDTISTAYSKKTKQLQQSERNL